LFNLLLYRRVCFFIFSSSEFHHVISRYPFMCVFGIVLSQALVIQFVNSVVSSLGFLERLDGSVHVSSSRSFSQSALPRLYVGLFSFACRRSVPMSRSNSMML